jgi:DNA ligase (NAD+)
MTSTNLRAIKAPSVCPSCGFILEWKNDLLYCLNADCYAKNSKRIEHWAKSLKIKGLGPATIEKLNLQSIEQIYELDLVTIVEALGSDLVGRKLFEEIQTSASASLESVLPAFGIPLIGETATAKLCKVISNINELSEAACKEAGLGPIATKNLMNWWQIAKNNIDNYPFSFSVQKQSKIEVIKGTICISGKLSSFKTKAEAAAALKDRGYIVKDSLTKDVTILVNESGIESAKTKKAKESGVTVITNLKLFLGDSNE